MGATVQVIAILGSLLVCASVIGVLLVARGSSRRRGVRAAVPGGQRRDFFGDSDDLRPAIPAVPRTPVLASADGPLAPAADAPLRRVA
jgi:hypothetical protein